MAVLVVVVGRGEGKGGVVEVEVEGVEGGRLRKGDLGRGGRRGRC